MINEVKVALSQLVNREFLAAAGTSLLFWGLLFGVLGFAFSYWWLKDGRAQVLALLLIVFSCSGVYPVTQWSQRKAPPTVLKEDLANWNKQKEKKQSWQWFYYGLGALGVVTLGLRGSGGLGDFLSALTIALGIIGFLGALILYTRDVEIFYPAAELKPGDARIR